MFCPKCATQNLEDAKFCRSCGTDISLVPQAVTGQLAARLASAEEALHSGRRGRHEDGPPSIERAVRSLFKGLAFVFVAFAVRVWVPSGTIWWFWLLIPAALMLADAVATYLRLSAAGKSHAAQNSSQAQSSVLPPRRAGTLPQREAGEMPPPPSVTDATTRQLGVSAERPRSDV